MEKEATGASNLASDTIGMIFARPIFGAALALALSLPAHADFTGKVVAVADGDTITVLDTQHQQHKIRLAGVDAPEKTQAFGQASKRHLSDLVFDRNVALDCGKTDKYRREVCVVMIDRKDANRAQVAAGMAWWYRKYQMEQTARQRADYEAAEASARTSRIGLWQDPDPVPPWEWRREKQ